MSDATAPAPGHFQAGGCCSLLPQNSLTAARENIVSASLTLQHRKTHLVLGPRALCPARVSGFLWELKAWAAVSLP